LKTLFEAERKAHAVDLVAEICTIYKCALIFAIMVPNLYFRRIGNLTYIFTMNLTRKLD